MEGDKFQKILKTSYNKSPTKLKDFIDLFYFPYIYTLCSGGRNYKKYVNFLEKSQWWKKERLEEYQLIKLKRLIKHSYSHVPYYRRLFKKNKLKPTNFKRLEDLKKIPIISRDDIINNFSDLISKNFRKKSKLLSHTSGSTGNPVSFYLDKDTKIFLNAFSAKAINTMNVTIENKHIFFRTTPFLAKKMQKKYSYYDRINKRLYISPISFKLDKVNKFISMINEFKPKYIIGNPSLMYLIAKEAKKNKGNYFKFLSTGEPLTQIKRDAINSYFNCEIFDWYCIKELSISAIECNKHNGLHIEMERGIFEVINKKDHPSNKGKVIGTNIHNLAMPLIRYDVGDIVEISNKKCSCGRDTPIISKIYGRENDFIILPDGRILTPPSLEYWYEGIEGIFDFRLIQLEKNHIVVKIVKSKEFSNNTLKESKKRLQIVLGKSINLEIEVLDNLKLENSGKIRTIVSKVKI